MPGAHPPFLAICDSPTWPLAASKPAEEIDTLTRWALYVMQSCNHIHVITHILSPLPYSIDEQQVTGPTHAQEGITQGCEHQGVGS